ncbi:MAG: hypothetical protein C4589_08350 [Peptococcaceae bacterium]|nr:MAG: hypothetical protein C4589_08350 [Peptococcaceae bacterium]
MPVTFTDWFWPRVKATMQVASGRWRNLLNWRQPAPEWKMQSKKLVSGEQKLKSRKQEILSGFVLFLLALVPLFLFMLKTSGVARACGYRVVREVFKTYVLMSAWRLDSVAGEHFYVRFPSGKRSEAELVLKTAERFYHPVTGDLNFYPSFKIPIVLYSNKEDLNRSLGWGSGESAVGIYWAGVIKVLSPGAWISAPDDDLRKEIFVTNGPVAHELAHLAVDYLSGGNYPRWFTEGVAQYEEFKYTGFRFKGGNLRRSLYSFARMSRDFDLLPDQSLAYQESFAVVCYIVAVYGEDSLRAIVENLGKGMEMGQAVKDVTGLDFETFEWEWRKWLEKNIELFS